MSIVRSVAEDLVSIKNLYNSARAYQTKKGYNVWPIFDDKSILREIDKGNHWKILEEDDIVCIFSVLFDDPLIWKEENIKPALYLHRITINPLYKGGKYLNVIKGWARKVCKEKELGFIRMDTWADNSNLSDYYIMSGFTLVGQSTIDKTEYLPEHYWGIQVNLFQIAL
ncbi:MAG TPA: hypothetical protein VF691_05425 [Cytophagaceae bacterium]|jgi:hypothetical protein